MDVEVGAMERAVMATLERLQAAGVDDARSQLAIVLARALDTGAGMATAAISRELRATLSELEACDAGDTDEFSALLRDLSTPVVNAKD